MGAPIRQETPLVRSMLLHFFDSDENFDSFSKYLTDEFLKPIFAEAKLTAAKGDAENWYSMLSTTQLKNLRERIDLSFAHQNKQSFAPDENLVIGPDKNNSSFFWFAGQGGYGFQTAAAASQLLSDLLLEKNVSVDSEILEALLPGRF